MFIQYWLRRHIHVYNEYYHYLRTISLAGF